MLIFFLIFFRRTILGSTNKNTSLDNFSPSVRNILILRRTIFQNKVVKSTSWNHRCQKKKTIFMSVQSIPKCFALHNHTGKREAKTNNCCEAVKLNTSNIMDHIDRDLNFHSPPLSRWQNNQERFQVLLLICSLCKYLNRQCAGQPNKSV